MAEDSKDGAKVEKDDEASWSSDVARNISRNKYLIKFKEFDKQQRPSLAQIEPEHTEKAPSIQSPDEQVGSSSSALATTDEVTNTMKLEAEAEETKEAPKASAPDCDKKKPAGIDVKPKKKKTTTPKEAAISGPVADDPAKPDEEQPVEPIELKKKTPSGGNKKVPVKRRNVKLKLKPIGTNKKSDVQLDGQKVEAPLKAVSDTKTSKFDETKETGAARLVGQPPGTEADQVRVDIVEKANAENERPKKSTVKSSGAAKKPAPTEPIGTTKRIKFREYKYDDFNFLSVLGHGGWGFVSYTANLMT